MKKVLIFLFTIGVLVFGSDNLEFRNFLDKVPGLMEVDENKNIMTIYSNILNKQMTNEKIPYSNRERLSYKFYQYASKYAKNNGYKLNLYSKKERFEPIIKKTNYIKELGTTIYEYSLKEDKVFTYAFINITKNEFKNWNKEKFYALEEILKKNPVKYIEEEEPQPNQFHWFTIRFEDGTGISFEYNIYDVVSYGIVDDQSGNLADYGRLGYMERTKHGYDFYKLDNWVKGSNHKKSEFGEIIED